MSDKNGRAIAYDSLGMSNADSKHIPEASLHLIEDRTEFLKTLFGPETSKTILSKDQVVISFTKGRLFIRFDAVGGVVWQKWKSMLPEFLECQ